MSATHETEQPVADRFWSGLDGSSEIRSTTAQPRAGESGDPLHAAGTFSVRLLAAQGRDQATAVLSVHGEIDIGTAPMLREALLPVLEQRTGPVLVDLREVPFMDSTAVHVLLEAVQRLESENRRLAIACREDGQVLRLLGLVGVLDAVTVHCAGSDGRVRPHRIDRRAGRYFTNRRPPSRSSPATPTPRAG